MVRTDLEWSAHRKTDALIRKIAWLLPHRLVMWCYIRVAAHGTTGAFGDTVVPDANMMEILKRWDSRRGGDHRYGTRDIQVAPIGDLGDSVPGP